LVLFTPLINATLLPSRHTVVWVVGVYPITVFWRTFSVSGVSSYVLSSDVGLLTYVVIVAF